MTAEEQSREEPSQRAPTYLDPVPSRQDLGAPAGHTATRDLTR